MLTRFYFFIVNIFYWIYFLSIGFLYQFQVLTPSSLFVHMYCNIYSPLYFTYFLLKIIFKYEWNQMYQSLLVYIILVNFSLGNFLKSDVIGDFVVCVCVLTIFVTVFIVLFLIFQLLINLDFIHEWCMKDTYFIFFHMNNWLAWHHLLNSLSFFFQYLIMSLKFLSFLSTFSILYH